MNSEIDLCKAHIGLEQFPAAGDQNCTSTKYQNILDYHASYDNESGHKPMSCNTATNPFLVIN